MGCAAATHVSNIEKLEEKLERQVTQGHHFPIPKRSEKRHAAVSANQVDTGSLSLILPHAGQDDLDNSEETIVRQRSADSTDSADCSDFSVVSVQIHVPAHLKPVVKDQPVLMEFAEPSQSECSWNMPDLRTRAKDLPVGIMVAPDRELHDQHMKKLDNYLKMISKAPRRLEGAVSAKKIMSGMGPERAANAAKEKARKFHGFQSRFSDF